MPRIAMGLAVIVTTTLGLIAPVGAADGSSQRDWGSVRASSGTLKHSCRNYAYSYRITAPENGDWDLNVTLVGPGGKDLWFGYLYEGGDPDQGTATFRLCSSSTRPGRYRLKSVVSVQEQNTTVTAKLPTARFRLHKR